jgi:hypothetical protein
MCVSQTELIPRKLPPPRFPDGYHQPKHKTDNGLPHYRVVKRSTVLENDETAEKKIPTMVTRVFFDGKGADELNDFLSRYPKLDAWRAGSTFDVEIASGGDWKKIYNRPY